MPSAPPALGRPCCGSGVPSSPIPVPPSGTWRKSIRSGIARTAMRLPMRVSFCFPTRRASSPAISCTSAGARNWAIVGCLKHMIQSFSPRDAPFPIGHGHGSDPIHKDPVYSYAVTELHDNRGRTGVGLAFTLGEGNQMVCEAARFYAQRLAGKPIKEIMAGFGELQHQLADEQQFRWLGPHKGVVQLALASVTNACWDLWAKTLGVPLWKLLLDLSPEQA